MANELKANSLILNEVKYVKEMLETKQIPSFWSTFNAVNRLTRYYLEQQEYDKYEIVGLVVQFLTEAKIDYSVETVVESITKIIDDKQYNLRNDEETILIYEEEFEIMKQLSITSRKYYFTFLLIVKIQEIRKTKNPTYIYYDLKDVGRLIGFDGSKNKFEKSLIEIGFDKKLILAPISGTYVEVKGVGGSKVALQIDEFNPLKIEEYYNTLFTNKKKIVAIEAYGDAEDFSVYESLRDAEKGVGAKKSAISDAINLAFKSRKTWEMKNGLIFIYVSESDNNSIIKLKTGFVQKLRPYYKSIMKGKIVLGEPISREWVLYDEEGNLLDEPYEETNGRSGSHN